MQASSIPLDQLNIHSKLITDFINHSDKINPFVEEFATVDSLLSKAQQIKKTEFDRASLSTILFEQNKDSELSEASKDNIERLRNVETLTVCTGHQLNMFTGPAYFVYKILSTIKLTRELNEKDPENSYVPLYWMASEDHDFEEINHTYAFSKRFEWDSKEKGKVGTMSIEFLNNELTDFIQTLNLQDESKTSLAIKRAGQEKSLSGFTRVLVNQLFGEYGVIVIDADSKELKSMFEQDMQNEILDPKNEKSVIKTSELLASNGYKVQVNPRAINLFYLSDQLRTRIIKTENGYSTTEGSNRWSLKEIQAEVSTHPERFSPNVILRPLYQQRILPNVAYIGGPGEIAYWLQLKDMFHLNEVIFPSLILRDQALIFNKSSFKKVNSLGLSFEELFKEKYLLEAKIIDASSNFNIDSQKEELMLLIESISNEVVAVDNALKGRIDLARKNVVKELDGLEAKVKKALKQKNDVQIQKITAIKNHVFPEGSFQERRENFFALQTFFKDDLFAELLESFEPLNHNLTIIYPS